MEPSEEYYDDGHDHIGTVGKACLLNAVAVAVYAVVIYLYILAAEGGELAAWVFFVGLGMLVHSGVTLVAGGVLFMMGRPKWGKGMWISTLLLLLIGFSTCVGAFTGFH